MLDKAEYNKKYYKEHREEMLNASKARYHAHRLIILTQKNEHRETQQYINEDEERKMYLAKQCRRLRLTGSL